MINQTKGQIFDALCIKAPNGKASAIFSQHEMMIKLNPDEGNKVLQLTGARQGTHLYAPERKMKNWVTVPFAHSGKWRPWLKNLLCTWIKKCQQIKLTTH
jgi:hypothetical protein